MKVAIITEGFNGTGYGHLTRCLSIYQAFEEKNIKPLFIANCDENGEKYLKDTNLICINWLKDITLIIDNIKEFDIAIIDSYLANFDIYNKIHENVKKCVYIDDYLRLLYPPGIIVNGTIGAENLDYSNYKQHDLLLGINYIPLRRAFWDIEVNRKQNNNKDILLIMGAQDNEKLLSKILSFLHKQCTNKVFHCVTRDKELINSFTHKNVKFYSGLNDIEMCDLMLNCDYAISAAGQTSYELNRIALPMILIKVVENQGNNIKGWLNYNIIKKINDINDKNLLSSITKELLEIMPVTLFCDGQGARRIVNKTINHL